MNGMLGGIELPIPKIDTGERRGPTEHSVVLGGIELTVYTIKTDERRGLIEHKVPGLDGSAFQDMGSEPVSISLEGTIHGKEVLADLEELRSKFKTGEAVSFVADIATAAEVDQVIIEDLTVIEVAGRPNHFRYTIKLRQDPKVGTSEQLQQGQTAQVSLGGAGSFLKGTENVGGIGSGLGGIGGGLPGIGNGLPGIGGGLPTISIEAIKIAEAESFLKETEKVMEISSGLGEIGIGDIKIGDQLSNVTDLLKEVGLLDLTGYSAPTFSGKLFQVLDDLMNGISDAIGEKEPAGKVAAIAKTFALILGKAVFTKVEASDKSGWEGLQKVVGEGVSG